MINSIRGSDEVICANETPATVRIFVTSMSSQCLYAHQRQILRLCVNSKANHIQIAPQRLIHAVLYYNYQFPTMVYAPENIC